MPAGSTVFSIVDPLGGGDYSTLQTWESTEQRSLTAADEIEVALCRSGGNLTPSSTLTVVGWASDAERYTEIRGDAGHFHKGRWQDSNARCEGLGGVGETHTQGVIRMGDGAVLRITRMQVRMNYTGTGNVGTLEGPIGTASLFDNSQLVIQQCILVNHADGCMAVVGIQGGGSDTGDGIGGRQHQISSSLLMDVRTDIADRGGVYGIRQTFSSPRIRVFNCTIIASGGIGLNTENAGGTRELIIAQNNYILALTPYDDDAFDADPGTSGILGKSHDAISAITDTGANPAGHNPALMGVDPTRHIFKNPISENEYLADWHLNSNHNGLVGSGYDVRADHYLGSGGGPYQRPERFIHQDVDGDQIVPGSGGVHTAGSGGVFPVGMDFPLFDRQPAHMGGYLSAEPGFPGSGFLGGYTLAEPTFDNFNNFIGAFLQAEGIPGQDGVGILGGWASGTGFIRGPASVGGFVDALPLIDASGSFLGGYGDAKHDSGDRHIGGFAWGVPGFRKFVETHARTLAKANSEDTSGQPLNIDATIAFIQRDQEDFHALFTIANTFRADFNARLVVGQFKKPPQVVITDVTPGSGLPGGGGIEVCVTASGNLLDGEQWVINQIDFGEPVRDGIPTPNNSISGFDLGNQSPGVWSGCYTYRDAGVYIVTARGVDNFGMVGMDHYVLNLASGLTAGVDYPLISISGTPRLGEVPPSLQVDYTLVASGALQPETPTDENLFWNFGNLARSNTVNPFTYYSSPGLYTPVARFRVQVSGQWRWAADTLRVGFNF